MKKVIVACGSGVATSQTVASKVTRLLKERNLDEIKVEVVDLKSVDTHIKNSAAYIAITKIEKQYPIPVINGIAFLTGINMEAELQKIIDACK
ncbi:MULTISPECIES: PTS sugar transporter subunit IIB [unclassified Gilliamella]|jgi:galactitol PTS system EIIB component|uniref:PTS sugar transporter subunit IIB n=1 Tax=unclassified Gilliamella TaxID=2685620 RepID=UPI00080E5D8F|nr:MULTISPECIES: PTS sugar transporter subunit IIB [Gilliamella]MWN05813.1 PTS galactitol transporter subunit IIB [Gilliamella sp. Pas-s95]MWN90820.1 PTS galactitol transporter subunit IIB [Gilliamella sp. Pra-s65]MWP46765.1 PTS galactitol transporter subunit IIB [Gilliamella sp. Pas-s27]MWP48424.1 PTS galactitol transporter subunit IIB [Gilliamella sp. Lep-s35]MWP61026.1 PTS galactitol transporter subunit IIB [Gilliamella sp. Pas-s25]